MPSLARDEVKSALAPLAPLLRSAVIEARDACNVDLVAQATPHITRIAHLRRLSGTQRWMVLADDLVRRADEMPDGYGVFSTELDHNRGRYAFRFPLGLLTVKRKPHEDGEGQYIQERLDGISEQLQLASGEDAFVGALVYLAVPPSGAVELVVTHATLTEPMVLLLDELEDRDGGVLRMSPPAGPSPRTVVRSRRKSDDEAGDKVDNEDS